MIKKNFYRGHFLKIAFIIIMFILLIVGNAGGAIIFPDEYMFSQNIGNYVLNTATINVAALTLTEASPGTWWDASRRFRLPITVDVVGFERIEKPVEVNLNFTQLLAGLGQAGMLDENSIRVVEIDSVGAILNDSVPFQFDKDSDFNAASKASGNVVFIMDGTTQASSNRYYHIYFDVTGGSYSPLSVAPLVTLTDNVIDQGMSSYKIEINGSTFFFQKEAGGFSSWDDKSGNDWIGWSTANASSGKYRGIPNAVNPEEVFHPGFNCCVSTIISQGPINIRVRSTNGTRWESIWDFYPRYATMTMTKADHNYWFLYEGTPGGLLEPNKDFMFRSSGIKSFLNKSWSGDIVNNEWVYFSDPAIGLGGRSLFVAHHEDDILRDQYWSHTNMTVFGFGRNETNLQKLLSTVPQHFTIGMIDGTNFTQNSKLIYSAYKDVIITKGIAEQYNSTAPAPLDPALKITIGSEVFNGTIYPTVTLENSVQKAVIRTKTGGAGGVESVIRDWILKSTGKDIVDSYVDANSFRGVLSSATVTVDGENSKTVRMIYTFGSIVEYTIDANSPIIKIKYEKYDARTTSNIVDRTNIVGQARVYGQSGWVRTISGSYYPCAYWDAYDTTLGGCGITYGPDPANAGSLNYKGHIITAFGQTTSNGIGFGRVMPVYTGTNGGIRILKVFSTAGSESYQAVSSAQPTRPAHYGYIYLFQQGVDNAITQGQQIVDNTASPAAPTILTQPSNQTVAPGQTATFSVVATGTTPLSYQWQKNGVNISGATNAMYTTPVTTLVDSGSKFQSIVWNSAGSVTSNSATLTVTEEATNISIINETRLTFDSYNYKDRQPAWSQDGEWIAYVFQDGTGNYEIYKMRKNGSGKVRLTNYSGFDLEPSWYPNNRILFSRGSGKGYEDIYVMNSDGSSIHKLTTTVDFDEYPDWSPDGTKIIYSSVNGTANGTKRIRMMNPDGSNSRQLNTIDGIQPAWSPDGTKIAFKSYASGKGNIWVMNADGSNPKQLTFDSANTHDPDWSPDSKYITYASNKDGDWDIYVMKADGSNVQKLTSNIATEDNYPAWSPDGRYIAYSSNRTGNEEIWIMELNYNLELAPLYVSIAESPNPVASGGTAQVTVHVTTTGNIPVAGADITVSAAGGNLNQTGGSTDANGDLRLTYTAPIVAGNNQYTISATASKTGYTTGSGSDLITITGVNLTVTISNMTVASGKTYAVDTLGVGKRLYIDRTYNFSSVPSSYNGLSYIKTANNDRYSTGSSFLQFDISQNATVYVAYNDAIPSKPSWLSSSFTYTGDKLVRDGTVFYSLYAKDFAAGHVTLGGNYGDGSGMYIVIVRLR